MTEAPSFSHELHRCVGRSPAIPTHSAPYAGLTRLPDAQQFPDHSRSSSHGSATWLMLLGIVLVAIGCSEKPVAPSPQTQTSSTETRNIPESAWAGSASCAECHAEIMHRYQSHPMYLTLNATSSATSLEDFSRKGFHTASGAEYYAEQDGAAQWHHERLRKKDGTVLYDQRFPIDYSVGSGAHGRSYLTNRNGRLFQSPVTWYTGKGDWGLSPGYSEDFHDRFERQVTHACLSCHAGRTNAHPEDQNRFAEPAFAEMPIGCERCHGPGQAHIDFRRSQKPTGGADPIVNPASFDGVRMDAVCNQCHLPGQRRVIHEGRSEFDFQPGMTLSELWTVFVKTSGVESGAAGAVSQVEQMYASSCYVSSEGKLTCISCHDPHETPAPAQVHEYYRTRCLQCHTSETTLCSESPARRNSIPEKDSCITCHMPRFEARDVHSAQTDHRVLRKPVLEDPTAPPVTADDRGPVLAFAEPGVAQDAARVARAKGIYLSERAYFGGDTPSAEEAIPLLKTAIQSNPKDIEATFSLARALTQLGQTREAAEMLEKTRELSPRHEEAIQTLASLYHETGKLRMARKAYEDLLEVNADRSRYYGRYTHVLGQLGETGDGIKAARKALELDPSLVQTHQWLAEALEKLGDRQGAARHQMIVDAFRSLTPK